MLEVFRNGGDIHGETAERVLLDRAARQPARPVNFSNIYGGGARNGFALQPGPSSVSSFRRSRHEPITRSFSTFTLTLSDGAENASRSYNLPGLRKAIEYRQKVCGWRFILISPHAATVAISLGIPLTNTLRWQADPVAVAALLERRSHEWNSDLDL
jgi:hypothetical protein